MVMSHVAETETSQGQLDEYVLGGGIRVEPGRGIIEEPPKWLGEGETVIQTSLPAAS